MIDPSFGSALLERYGSPLYVYDLDELQRRARCLRGLLPERARLFYSLKTNPLAEVCAALREAGCAVEISSSPELCVAREAGFSPEEMLYSGPGKTGLSNHEALAAGLRDFTCDSWTDLERLSAAARESELRVRALMRLNISDDEAYRVGVGARQSHFGVALRSLIDGLESRLPGLPGVELTGIHVYAGTQLPDPAALCQTFASTLALAERLCAEGLDVGVIDLGGGFPWPFATADAEPDLGALRDELARLDAARRLSAGAQLWFESGRYLAASCGTLLATVLDVKGTPERTTVVLDAGTSQLGGLSGLGLIHRASATPSPLTPRAGEPLPTDVVGPTDSPLDRIARNTTLSPLQPGDVVAIPNVGAYGLTASLVAFAGRPSPVEVCCRGTELVSAWRLRGGHDRLGDLAPAGPAPGSATNSPTASPST